MLPCAARASTSPNLRSGKRHPGKVSDKDITLFSRQLATMVKSGVPLLQSFDIVGKGTNNPALAKLLYRHQSRRRDWIKPGHGVPQIPDVF
jgi:type II secretory pathway component PulF